MIKNFRDLEVWRKTHELAQQVFSLTDAFPRSYLFDLTAQLRRAALSVPTNLAEGCAAGHSKELIQFINIAKRSVSETQYLLWFACERTLVEEKQHRELDERYEEVNRMLGGLKRSLSTSQGKVAVTHHSSLATGH